MPVDEKKDEVLVQDQPIAAPQKSKKLNKTEFINALKSDFVTTVKKVYVNSLQKEVGFREITVKEQKTLSRIMIDNENRKDVVYDAQCALINQVCLDEGFDIYQCSEFDKIKLMMSLYQTNMFKNEINFKCKECGTQNRYKIDFRKTISKLDDFDTSDKNFNFENENWKFSFVVGYPTVKKVSEFYKIFTQKYKKASEKEIETMNNMINMDYMNMFVKHIDIVNKQTGKETAINAADFTAAEIEDIFSAFPQDVLYVDDGVITYITKNYISSINDTFEKHKCGACGAVYGEAIDETVDSFF